MRKLLKIMTLTLVLTSVGSQAFAWSYYSTPRIGGGYNFYGDGLSGYSTPRIGGGFN